MQIISIEVGNHAINQTINHAWRQKGSFINWILKIQCKSSLSRNSLKKITYVERFIYKAHSINCLELYA